jgi:hypothetical protein
MGDYENVYCAAIEIMEGKELTAFGFAGEKSGKAHIAEGDETALAQSNFYGEGCDYGYLRTDWSTGAPIVQYSYTLHRAAERLFSPSAKTESPITGFDKNSVLGPIEMSPPAWILERAGYLSEFNGAS